MKQLVAIVGRPNVGKSTLVNRIAGERISIVDDTPGVTRDRLYVNADWNGKEFMLIDTGGLIFEEEGKVLESIQKQAWLAIQEADLIVFMGDLKTGVTPADREIASELYKYKKPIILIVNKQDEYGGVENWVASEFYELALGDPIAISAFHGIGVGDLLDKIVENLTPKKVVEDPDNLKIAIVGRPNVGKSSIINGLLNEEKMIVDDVPGTTRDAIDTEFKFKGKHYTLIDTAGIRKKGKVEYGIEKFAVVRALKAISRCDVALLVLDISDEVSSQDQRIGGIIDDSGKPCVLILNKWDLIEDKNDHIMKEYTDTTRNRLYYLNYAPLLFTSTVTRKRLFHIFDIAEAATEENQRRITTGALNQALTEIMALNPPPSKRGKRAKIYYANQVKVAPPTFLLFVNNPELMTETYLRYLEHKLRDTFGFMGTPIRFKIKGKKLR